MKSKSNLILSFIILFLVLTIAYFLKTNYFQTSTSNDLDLTSAKLKSGNLSTDYSISTALGDIEKFNLNAINLPIAIHVDNLSSTTMAIDQHSQEKAIELIEILQKQDIIIILEPYPWIADGSMYETDWDPSDIDAFFYNWRTQVLKPLIDEVANPYNIEILNIGTGFNHMEYAHGYFEDLIDYVKEHYQGLVTYRTSWWLTASWDPDTMDNYTEKLNNPLFAKLDFISIAAYFELTNNDTNPASNLVEALYKTQLFDRGQNVVKEVESFYDKWEKPIFFGELGFPRTTRASVHPWNPYESTSIDNQEQANCYKAYREVFEKEPWFMGFSVFAIGEDSDDKLYYPSEESADIIRNWYN